MRRRALIVYCNDTESGPLKGPIRDCENLCSHLMSNIGGNWYSDEILALPNPSLNELTNKMAYHYTNADYTFTVFSGHGFIHTGKNNTQYVELKDQSCDIGHLISRAKKQTLIVDACRGYYQPIRENLEKSLSGIGDVYNFEGHISTRELFDRAVRQAKEGLTALFAASEDQSALDTNLGGAYILSLLSSINYFAESRYQFLPMESAHVFAQKYIGKNFDTIQNPKIVQQANKGFPFAVKY